MPYTIADKVVSDRPFLRERNTTGYLWESTRTAAFVRRAEEMYPGARVLSTLVDDQPTEVIASSFPVSHYAGLDLCLFPGLVVPFAVIRTSDDEDAVSFRVYSYRHLTTHLWTLVKFEEALDCHRDLVTSLAQREEAKSLARRILP